MQRLAVFCALLGLLLVAPSAGAEERPRIAAFGDSLLAEASDYLRFFGGLGGANVTVEAEGGAALCDFVPRIRDAVTEPGVDAVVVAFSGNNLTRCASNTEGNGLQLEALGSLYRHGTSRVMDAARPDLPVLWVTAPTNPRPNPDGDLVRAGTIGAASEWRNARVVDGGEHITPNGSVAAIQPCLFFEPCLGPDRTNIVRAPDGTHFCPTAKLDDPRPGPCSTYSSGALRYALTILGPALAVVGRSY